MSEPRKKKVLIHTDYPMSLTGFGKHALNLFKYLHSTNKYELYNLAVGAVAGSPDFARLPWTTIGAVHPQKLEVIRNQNDPKNWDNLQRMAGYGAFAVDDAVKEIHPDIYIGIQDPWGLDYTVDKPWYKQITSVIWTTLDSLPILPQAVVVAQKSALWSWADFATKALHKMGYTHVKTVRGIVDTKNFYRLPNRKRAELRNEFKIPQDCFIIGDVFRNQLRKSVSNILQGFKMFKRDNPTAKAKLLFHTHWNEGWDIKRLCEEMRIPLSDVFTTYVCRNCKKYEIKPFTAHEENCRYCNGQKSQVTTSPGFGINEQQLNEVYNLMDVGISAFTSGGQEYNIMESKMTELITLVTNYSCGEDSCQPEAASLPLDWAEYRDPNQSMFIKASTYPSSIAKQLTKVFNMSPKTREEMGKKARQWVIDNFSIEVIGKFVEDFIDKAPLIEDPTVFDGVKLNPNPYYQVPVIPDDGEWILHLYHNILDRKEVNQQDPGYVHWMARINKELPRQQIEEYFRQVAFKTLQEQKGGIKFEDLLNPDDKGRVLVVVPENADDVYACTSLFGSIKSRYPDYALYVATKAPFRDILNSNPYVDKWLEYHPMMENFIWAEGKSEHKGFFNICYLPCVNTQKILSTPHNGEDKIDFSLMSTIQRKIFLTK